MFVVFIVLFTLMTRTRAGFGLRLEPVQGHTIVFTPTRSAIELDSQIWTQSPTVLRHSNGLIHTLHNYTGDSRGRAARWTRRELTENLPYSPLQRRAFTYHHENSRTNLWKIRAARPGIPRDQQPFRITMCLTDEIAEDRLLEDINAAVCRWNNALGPNRGIEFVWTANKKGPRICLSHTMNQRKNQLFIHYEPLERGDTTIGYQIGPGLTIGDVDYPMEDGYSLASAITRELGHVLGLWNEHQRPDSIFDLFFTCANVPGYHDLERHLQQNPGRHVWAGGPNEGQPLTMLDFCTHGELSLASEYREIWDGLDWVPFSFDYMDMNFLEVGPGNPTNKLWNMPELEAHGGFDMNSVMMPCGWYLLGDNGLPIFTHPNGEWNLCPGPEIYPSQADVAAINLMYPPVPNPMPPPGGNAGPAVPADAPAPPFGPGGPLELPANVGRP